MITRLKLSTIEQGLPKYRSMLAGNDAFIPTAFESIATTTVGAGGAATIDFTSISGTYKHLQLRFIGRGTSTSNPLALNYTFNGVTSSSYTAYHDLQGDGSSASAAGFGANTYAIVRNWIPGSNLSNTTTYGVAIMDILDYADTNKYKTVRTLSGFDRNGSGEVHFSSNLFMSTNAISSISLYPESGNWAQYSSIALYGIKGA